MQATFFPLEPLKSAILEIIIQNSSITTKEILVHVKEDYDLHFSDQYVYRIIKEMLAARMITKAQGKLRVEMRWISQVQKIIGTAFSKIHIPDDDEITRLLPEQGKSSSFMGKSIRDHAVVWDQLTYHLIQNAQDKRIWVYESHPYWDLSPTLLTQEYNSICKQLGGEFRTVYGNDTFLDTIGLEDSGASENVICVHEAPYFSKEGYVVQVIENYVFELTMPLEIDMHFRIFFENVQKASDFREELYRHVFNLPIECGIEIHHDPARAQEVKNELNKLLEEAKNK